MEVIDEIEVHPLSIMQNARRHGGKDPKYEKALKPYMEEFRNKMKEDDKYIYDVIIDEDRIRDILGFPLNTFSLRTISENIRLVLWKYDIVMKMEWRADGKRIFLLNRRRPSDRLLYHQQKIEGNDRPKPPRM